jgi:hypothetical protein
MSNLTSTVYVHDADGVARTFGPSDVVPEWAAVQITNLKAWRGGELPTASKSTPAAEVAPAVKPKRAPGRPPKTPIIPSE